MNKIETIYYELCAVSVFKSALNSSLIKDFISFVKEKEADMKIRAYSSFVSNIYENGGILSDYIKKLVFEDENVFVITLAHNEKVDTLLENSVKRELLAFEKLSSLSPLDFILELGLGKLNLAEYRTEKIDLIEEYYKRLKDIDKHGYGIFASKCMFRLTENNVIEPVASADKQSLTDFVGYEEERGKIIKNTEDFLNNKPCLNALLYGDAGTGKSSTVKAIANEYFKDGLRLIEIRKDQLHSLPLVMEKISVNPLKFIIFIDDLSFNQNDDNFSMLKAALEGSASAKAKNAVIYATSNRRHIVRESFADRNCDDVHVNDTMQETLSLSERFGLSVMFAKPNKVLYLDIVKELANRKGLKIDEKQLETMAEAFALKRGNRSARCAEQFIDGLL